MIVHHNGRDPLAQVYKHQLHQLRRNPEERNS